jgi:hydrogenase expression/formation protein HypC
MCLAVPGKVISKFEAQGIRMGKMDFDGITKDICLEYVPDIQIGEYAIVHVGFAMEKVDEQAALETLQLFRNMGFLEEELGESDNQTNYSFETAK